MNRWMLFAPILGVFIALLVIANIATAQAADGETVRYKGYGPQNIADIYQGRWSVSEVGLNGELRLPAGEGPFPVVVLQHGSGHIRHLSNWYSYVIPALHKAGIGAFIADSYGGRNISGTGGDQRQLSKAARVVDALMALKALSTHARVDAGRVGVTGYSFGGIVAIETANRRTVEAVLGTNLRFAAHLPVYPSCGAQHEKIDMTGAPMHFLLGEDDDYTPAKFCLTYLPKLQAAGVPATFEVYPGVGHAFVNITDRYLDNAATFNKCGVGPITAEGYHVVGGILEKGKSWSEFVFAAYGVCGSRGASLKGTWASRKKARDDTVAFFTKTLNP